MKKIFLILLIASFTLSCSQDDDLPIPLDPVITTTPTASVQSDSLFYGVWNCYDWVFNPSNMTLGHYRIILSESGENLHMTARQYYSDGTPYAFESMNSVALLDGNSFHRIALPMSAYYKGYYGELTSDTTIDVYEYWINNNIEDTIQFNTFYKQ